MRRDDDAELGDAEPPAEYRKEASDDFAEEHSDTDVEPHDEGGPEPRRRSNKHRPSSDGPRHPVV
ncbi:hypothetical protein AB0I55_23210 [Actinocatenispora sera]|uniref:Uncharacterized protein n=1 Tax=Actinocatenispora sera TaxID=390989 RepID=A0A810L8V5_9ACTN|nr:hypothetical protein [Actinocatenispora sera]BCJ31723.1 hypothetical protein Asera_58310 [Actinocatenispora sera]